MFRRLALLAALLPLSSLCAQAGLDTVHIVTTQVAPGVYMLVGQGGNMGVSAGPDGKFLIDDEFAPLTPRIDSALAAIGPQPLRFVINTHFHGDHTGGNQHYGDAGVLIIAQDNVRKRLTSDQLVALFNQPQPAAPHSALPIITFADSVELHFNGDEVLVFHVPHAHTDGDLVIHFAKANVVHMADTYFSSRYPLVDVSNGGSIDGMIAAVDRVLKMTNDSTRYIAGHGTVTGRAELVRYRDMLADVRGRVRALRASGNSLAQIQAAKPSAKYDAVWGKGRVTPDLFVKEIYDSWGPPAKH